MIEKANAISTFKNTHMYPADSHLLIPGFLDQLQCNPTSKSLPPENFLTILRTVHIHHSNYTGNLFRVVFQDGN